MVIIQSPFDVTCKSLATALRGKLILATIPPLHGADTMVSVINLDAKNITPGQTYLHCGSSHSLITMAAKAFSMGANGVVCVGAIPPLAGAFTISLESFELVYGAQYPLVSHLLSGETLLQRTGHAHHLRRSA